MRIPKSSWWGLLYVAVVAAALVAGVSPHFLAIWTLIGLPVILVVVWRFGK